ncbi:MAG: RNA polymerase sigma factor [Candidatus Aureabacteria bacterium]|nr:RNA polymerase sigma factor [Candidatus Auribacterota bacterium]
MDRTDEQIMLVFQSGDINGVEMLFERYKIRIFNFCYRILGNRSDAEEVAGDVFMCLVSQKSTFDPQKTFSTWLYTIARNKCISRIRKQKKMVLFGSFFDKDPEKGSVDIKNGHSTPSESLVKKETSEHVRHAIAGLPPEQREAITLKQYHDLSYLQISEVLDCSLEKVKILIFRAKEQLRIELASFILEEQR